MFITNVGGCVRADMEMKALRIKEGELEAIVSGTSRSTQQMILFRGVRSWLYHKLTCGAKTPENALADTRAQIECASLLYIAVTHTHTHIHIPMPCQCKPRRFRRPSYTHV